LGEHFKFELKIKYFKIALIFQVDMVRSIGEKKKNLSQGVLNILQTISTYENIPRKKAKFLNFMKNSFRYMKANELDDAWTLLEEAMRENKSQQQQNGNNNGNQQQSNGVKRKLEEDDQNGEEQVKTKKAKVEKEPLVEAEVSEKFNWGETIRSILLGKNNEINLKKLKKKVLNKYKKTGGEISDKIESKFGKKLKKLNGIVVDNEKVRLIE
jgi:cell growth-regulating nucleolar protein